MRSPFAAEAFPSAQLTEYEKISPHDGRYRIKKTLAVPFRWVCWVKVNGVHRGSGVLIGPSQVLTAAHIIRKRGKWADSVYVAPARNGSCQPFGQFKAITYATTSEYLASPRPGSRFDLAMITLDRDVSETKTKGHGSVRLGYWGEADQTDMRPLDPCLLTGKLVTACGYPGDKCDGKPIDPLTDCTQDTKGNTMWAHHGKASFIHEQPGLVYLTAGAQEGQSGGPIWIKSDDGRRSLVGVYVGLVQEQDKTTGKYTTVSDVGVHLNEENFAQVRSWFPAGEVRKPR